MRMLYADSAYMSWRLLQWEHMDAGRWRWLSYLTQCAPWLAVKAHAPAAVVLATYSFALQLPHTLVSYLAWKKAATGTAMASLFLSAVWMQSAWFIPVSEMHLAAAVLLLWCLYPRQGWLSALAWFTHPGIGPFALFLVVFPGEWQRRKWALLWLLPAILVKQAFSDAYEQGFAAGLLEWNRLPTSYVFAYLARVWSRPEWLLSLALLPLSWRHVERRIAVIHLLACSLLLLLLALVYQQGDGDVWMQKNLLPLSMALAFPLWQWLDRNDRTPAASKSTWLILASLPLMALTLLSGQQEALRRLKSLEACLQAHNTSGKWLIQEDKRLHQALGAVWALPYESLLFSTWKTPDAQQTLLPSRDVPPAEARRPDVFIGAPFTPPLSLLRLNRQYFRLPLHAYQFTDSGKILR